MPADFPSTRVLPRICPPECPAFQTCDADAPECSYHRRRVHRTWPSDVRRRIARERALPAPGARAVQAGGSKRKGRTLNHESLGKNRLLRLSLTSNGLM
jgi:hypothetical protein